MEDHVAAETQAREQTVDLDVFFPGVGACTLVAANADGGDPHG